MSVLHVVFRVGTAEYVLPAADVVQMESFSGATPVPGSPAYVAGLVQVRGRVLPVIDARARFGLPPAERNLDTRVVVGQVAAPGGGLRTVGLIVDAAREVVKLDPEQLRPPPPLVAEQARGFVKAVAQVGGVGQGSAGAGGSGRLLLLIDLNKVVGEEQVHAE
ncbi:purine-binding chemotaxis protein CheW [Aggregicoccus sp. 17bor-14]|uniref:chemotaxis protein CheW n=1 Tax=Myxococcaceae TaxID=31 RepID=UPI00129CF4B3|nr:MULTISPECIES: chemotaxis protein CheW [Myxococcaceae]MBF5045270.1 purine-binding chemotaxis protein CheW [Simulacricoccus sp. 17bor-14]MRI91011.1 purine-binding chemotaxis protein CheW [Aggregicoccus sp. 17bor-14]